MTNDPKTVAANKAPCTPKAIGSRRGSAERSRNHEKKGSTETETVQTRVDGPDVRTLRTMLDAGQPLASNYDAELELMAAKVQQLVEQGLEFDRAHNDVECERCDREARKLQEEIFQLSAAGPRGLLAKLHACLPGYTGPNLPYYGDFSEDTVETLCIASIYRDLRRLASLHDQN